MTVPHEMKIVKLFKLPGYLLNIFHLDFHTAALKEDMYE
jgi:hypothetical protein